MDIEEDKGRVKILKFNTLFDFEVKFTARFLDVPDSESIESYKNKLYQTMAIKSVPFVEFVYRSLSQNKTLEKIYLWPFATAANKNSVLLNMLLNAKRNYKTDDYQMMRKKRMLIKESNRIFELFNPADDFKPATTWDNGSYLGNEYKEAIDRWEELQRQGNMEELDKELENILGENGIELRAVDWAEYIRNNLFQNKDSLLNSQSEDMVSVIDYKDRPFLWPYKTRQGAKEIDTWRANVLKYRTNVLEKSYDESSPVDFTPSDYDLVNREKISFFIKVPDTDYIAGYVTCSLTRIPNPTKQGLISLSPDFNKFHTEMTTGNTSSGLGYHIFSIEGLHVQEKYRRDFHQPSFAKILFFYANEFIRQTFNELGVSLIVVDSEAPQTAHILRSVFGFTFASRYKDLLWIENQVVAFKESVKKNLAKDPEITKAVNYFKNALKFIESYRNKYQTLPLVFTNIYPDFNIDVEQLYNTMQKIEWEPFPKTKDKKDSLSKELETLLDKMRQIKDSIYKTPYVEKEADSKDSFYQRQINVYLNHYIEDDQDTFLYLKNNNIFDEKMKAFSRLFKGEIPIREVIVIDDDDDDDDDDIEIIPYSQTKRSVHNGRSLTQIVNPPLWLEPTELDMILYSRMESQLKKEFKEHLEIELAELIKTKDELMIKQQEVDRLLEVKKKELADIGVLH